MRHHNAKTKFGRKTNVRRAFIRSLALSLIEHGRIQTTETRAKALRPIIEKMVTRAKKGDLASMRLLSSELGGQPEAATRLISVIAPNFKERAGGYTRVLKLPPRTGDASPRALIEFV